MKKLALSAILGASLMISSSAFALTAMNDAGMKSATGQAGVSIAIDNVVIEQYVGSTKYTDESGAYDATAGTVVIGDKHTVKTFLAMTSATDFATDFRAATGGVYDAVAGTWTGGTAATGPWSKAASLSIDVGNCSALTKGLNSNITNLLAALPTLAAAGIDTPAEISGYLMAQKGYTVDEAASAIEAIADNAADETVVGVVIGLPTLLIKTTSDEYTVGLEMEGAINNGDDFIKISKGASAMAILGGTVEIAAH